MNTPKDWVAEQRFVRVLDEPHRDDADYDLIAAARADAARALAVIEAADRLAEWLDQSHEVEPECEEMGCVVCRRLAAYREVRG